MPSKSTTNEDHAVADQFLKKHRWKPGRGRDLGSWFLPSLEFPRISIFWTSSGTPSMTYNEESAGRGMLMVRNGKKMEDFSYGVEQITKANPGSAPQYEDEGEVDDGDRLKSTLQKTLVAMRNW